MNIEKLLIKEEGLRLKPYKCPAGFLTIGVGRNLDANGISIDEAMSMLRSDIDYAKLVAEVEFGKTFFELSCARQAVVVSMIFQMGKVGFLKFTNTIRLIKDQKFEEAASQMLKSKWAKKDSPLRAKRHAETMRTGEWLEYYK